MKLAFALLFIVANAALAAVGPSGGGGTVIPGGSTNVALLNGTNVFTGTNTFNVAPILTSGITATAGKVSSTDGFNASGNLAFYTGGSTLVGYFQAAGSHFVGKGDGSFGGSILALGVDSGFPVSMTKSGNNILLSPAATAGYVAMTNLVATNILADGYRTTQQTLGYTTGTNLTVNATTSLHFVSLTNTAYFTAPTSLGVGASFTVHIQQDATGTRAVTFDTNYWKFPGGVVPTITTNALGFDVLSCISCPYGTNVFAIVNQNFR